QFGPGRDASGPGTCPTGIGKYPRSFAVGRPTSQAHDQAMNAETQTRDAGTFHQVRQVLLELARREDDLAAREAASLPYWSPCPPSIAGHRAAAVALRCEADQLRYAS